MCVCVRVCMCVCVVMRETTEEFEVRFSLCLPLPFFTHTHTHIHTRTHIYIHTSFLLVTRTLASKCLSASGVVMLSPDLRHVVLFTFLEQEREKDCDHVGKEDGARPRGPRD